jgi:hypothetical protein
MYSAPETRIRRSDRMRANAQWAVITGASSGIGRALAVEFASAGFNVWLAGRNRVALDEAAAECAATGVETDVVAADLATPAGVDTMIAALRAEPRQISILANNAGFGLHGGFAATPPETAVDMIHVQLTAAVRLTRHLLPAMIERRDGRILIVASVYSFSPVPYQSIYGASKAFLSSWASALGNELQGSGVTVTLYCPGTTQTAFRSRAGIGQKRSDSGMTAAEVAKIGVWATLGGRHVVVPGFWNRLFVLVTRHAPVRLVPRIVRIINRKRGQNHT